MSERAWDRVTDLQRKFIDRWIETAHVRKSLLACGLKADDMPLAMTWFNHLDFKMALKERTEELSAPLPSGIASQEDALRVLHELLYSQDEEIQLKAAVAILKSKNPRVNVTNINLKEALDAAMKTELIPATRKPIDFSSPVYSWAEDLPER